MKIIEFAGLSGCGKSTACNEIINQITEKKKIFTYRELIMLLHIRKIYIPLLKLNPFRQAYNKKLQEYAAIYEDVSVNAVHVLMTIYDTACILDFFYKDCLAVLEEGFVQTLTSIPHLQAIQNKELLSNVLEEVKKKHEIVVVDCRADTDTVIKRLRERNSGDRFNAIKDDNKLYEALQNKQSNIDIVESYFDYKISVDMEQSREKIVEDIMHKLEMDKFIK